MDLERYFSGYEDKLLAELSMERSSLTHSGNKGANLETKFRTFLSDHLPRRLEVAHGEVIDSMGAQAGDKFMHAGQIDTIIIDDEQPKFGNLNEPSTYFIESVNAAAEVKALLTSSQISSIVEKASRFKSLSPKFHDKDTINTTSGDIHRFYNKRPFFLFCYESQLTPEGLLKNILAAEKEQNLSATGHLDAIFCLDRGSLYNLGDGQS